MKQPLSVWIKLTGVALLLLGIFFRFYRLDHLVYWIDETFTSLRLSGYTKTEFVEAVFTGKLVGIETLWKYQHLNPDKSWIDTVNGIAAEESQLTPLYFVLLRGWVEGFGDSVVGTRSFSAVISLLAFPGLWWLCWELFQSALVAGVAIILVALTPLHVLYAQEARPYCLWTVITVFSSAALLSAMRTQTRRSWSIYAVTVALGLYTHLLFGAVAMAHGVYIAITEKPLQQRRISKIAIAYLLATAAAILAFVPWIALFLSQFNRFDSTQEFGQDSSSLPDLVSEWVENINQAFLGESIGLANGLLALLAVYALYWLCRQTPQRTWLFVLTLVGIPFLALAVPDIVWGGGRSLRIRYVIPSYVGIQLALAYLFATQAVRIKTAPQTLWRMVLLLLLTGNIIACIAIAQAQFWWSKGGSRCAYYFPVAAVLNSAEVPLVISDRRPSDLLGLTHYLNPPVYYQLVTDPKQLQIAPQFQAKFLLNPSLELRENLSQQGYRLKLLYQDPNEDGIDQKRFWQVGDRQ